MAEVSGSLSARRLVTNLGALAAGRLLTLAFSTATVALVARDLGPAHYGQLALAIAYTAVVFMVADAGISFIAPRDLARVENADQRRALATRMATLSTCIFVGCDAAALGLALVLFPDGESLTRTAIAVLLTGGLFTPMVSVGTALAAAAHRQHLVAIAQVTGGLITLAAVVGIMLTGAGAAAIAAAYAATTVAAGLVLVVAPGNRLLRPHLNITGWWAILSESLPMLAAAGLNTLYGKADILLLAILTTSADVGRYGLAYKVADAVIGLPSLVILVLQPIMVSAYADRHRFDNVVESAMLGMQLIAIPVVIVLVRFASGVSLLLGGHTFSGASHVVAILAVAAGITFPTALLSAGLVTFGRQRRLIVTTAVAFVTNIVANLILIPKFGISGAAWALVISESAVLITFALTYRRYARLPRPRNLRSVATATAGLTLVAILGPLVLSAGPVVSLAVWGFASVAVYCALLVVLSIPQSIVRDLTTVGADATGDGTVVG